MLVWLGVLLAIGAAAPAHAQGPGTLNIGFWCAPPPSFTSAARYQQIAAAGFTFAPPPCNVTPTVAENQAILDAAATAGVKVYIRDGRIPASMSAPNAAANLDAVIADYAGKSALAGYDLADEPAIEAFAGLGQVVTYLREHDPAHPAFINVFPNYGPYQGSGYEDYLRRYAIEANTSVFSYDHYPFTTNGDRPQFFPNLISLRNLSLSFSRPFWEIGLTTPHFDYRQPTEAEKRWQVFQSMAYGASGVSYFTYWSVTNAGFGPGIINSDGTTSAQYAEVQRINARAQAIGRYLVTARSTDVFHNPPIPGNVSPRRPGTPVYVPTNAQVTVGVFETGEQVYMLVTNRSYTATTTTNVDLSYGATLPQSLNPATGAWSTVSGTSLGSAITTSVSLAPGDAALFRAAKPVPVGSLGPEAFFARVRSDASFLHVVDSSGATYQVGSAGWGSCPSGYTNVGQDFHSNGFFMCARNDLVTRRFYVGNVVNDAGYYWRVENGVTTRIGLAGWSQCTAPALYIGQYVNSNRLLDL